VLGYENNDLLLRSYDGGIYRYPDAGAPLDAGTEASS
jgi:hypothetical protein